MLPTELPAALTAALPLLTDQPARPDVSAGYLDLLGEVPADPPGPIQAFWASAAGSRLYDRFQDTVRRLSSLTNLPDPVLRELTGGTALDVGCGPGSVTARLGEAVGPDGLALGVDVSEPMLARAVAGHTAPNVGFLRADARRLPVRDAVADVVTCMLVLQLIPEPYLVLDELARVVKPGGRVLVIVPTPANGLADLATRLLPVRRGLEFFDEDTLAGRLHSAGLRTVHTRRSRLLLTVTGSA